MLTKRLRRMAAGCVLQSCWAVAICTALWAQSGGNDYLVTTVAGNGNRGDGGSSASNAASVALWIFDHLCADSSGNLYIAETEGGRIRKVTPSGTITTVAGGGHGGDGGLATD